MAMAPAPPAAAAPPRPATKVMESYTQEINVLTENR